MLSVTGTGTTTNLPPGCGPAPSVATRLNETVGKGVCSPPTASTVRTSFDVPHHYQDNERLQMPSPTRTAVEIRKDAPKFITDSVLDHSQKARAEALRAARSVLTATTAISSSAVSSTDLILVAEYILQGWETVEEEKNA